MLDSTREILIKQLSASILSQIVIPAGCHYESDDNPKLDTLDLSILRISIAKSLSACGIKWSDTTRSWFVATVHFWESSLFVCNHFSTYNTPILYSDPELTKKTARIISEDAATWFSNTNKVVLRH